MPPVGGDGPSVPMVMARLSFGHTPELRTEIETLGWEAWVDQQLDPWSIDDTAAQDLLAPLSSIRATNAQNRLRPGVLPEVLEELRHARVLMARYSKRQLYELMVEFWSDHFNIGAEGKWWDYCKATDEAVYRAHALGKFSDLLLGSARSVAMGLYLDNAHSDYDDGVNENYGRELLELHTLGIIDGVQAYTEEDVVAAAHVMAGWSLDWDTYTFEFKSYAHSPEAHQLLGGQWQRPERPSRNGEQDGVSMLSFLAHHPSTAQYLAWKLCRRFVSDQPSAALVNSAAGVYLANDTAIAPVLRHIIQSAEFAASEGVKLRRPFDWCMAALRATDAHIGNTIGDYRSGAVRLQDLLDGLGHLPFAWPAPNGYPEDAAHWSSASGLLGRWNGAARIGLNDLEAGDPMVDRQLRIDPAELLGTEATTIGEAVDALADRILGYPLRPEERLAILELTGGDENLLLVDLPNRPYLETTIALLLTTAWFQFR